MIDLFIRFFILFISIYIFNYNIRYDTDDIGGMFSLLNINLFLIIIIIMTLYSIIELIYST